MVCFFDVTEYYHTAIRTDIAEYRTVPTSRQSCGFGSGWDPNILPDSDLYLWSADPVLYQIVIEGGREWVLTIIKRALFCLPDEFFNVTKRIWTLIFFFR